MEVIEFEDACFRLHTRIAPIDFDQLPISEYNKAYMKRLRPALYYYLDIYSQCFKEGFSKCGMKPEEITLVDYGGGIGFLSMLAKEIGVGKVIYIDLNEKSVEAAGILKQEAGTGPDVILHGDSRRLAEWCREEKVCPDLLLSTDVIEHIYDLPGFFSDIFSINDNMRLVFTTASTPYNPYIKRRLRKFMRQCESGKAVRPNYYTKRVHYIRKEFPALRRKEVKKWAIRTRGLIYEDIHKAISRNERPLLLDAYNTCDPETGNFAERILTVREYKELAKPYAYKLSVYKGFYNTLRQKQWKAVVSVLVNLVIKYSGKAGFILAPYILLSYGRK